MSFFNSFNRKFGSATYLQIKKDSFGVGFLIFQKLKAFNSELLFPLRGFFWEDGNSICSYFFDINFQMDFGVCLPQSHFVSCH